MKRNTFRVLAGLILVGAAWLGWVRLSATVRATAPLSISGDGAGARLWAAGLGVAFHAKPAVAAEVAARIDHGDLTSLLYLQGYRQTDFVEREDP